MKSTDLMLGDWVEVNSTPLQIAALGTIKAGFIDGKGEMFYHYYDTIKPIPVTTELLQKMGLKLLEVGDHGTATPPNMFNRFEKWELKTKWCTFILWKDRRHEVYHLAEGKAYPIKYLHQLQHEINAINITDFIVKL